MASCCRIATIGRHWAVGAAALTASAGSFIALVPSAVAANQVHWMRGVNAPGTPKSLDRVGVLKIGPARARNILVFNPGTSAGSGYIAPFARTLVRRVKGWQVWSVERRENQLEDQSMAEAAKEGRATPQELFDYYLGWIQDPLISPHFQPIPDRTVGFAKLWGMRVELGDLRRVVRAASRRADHVVMMGHSLGGSITTAYATWDFHGEPGAQGLSGLVYDDGGSSPRPITRDHAERELADLATGSPWLAFGGITAPYAGLFAEGGAILALIDSNGPSKGQEFLFLPSDLRPPVPVTNLAQWGYASDTETSPPNLWPFQAHDGHLAPSGSPRGWQRAGELTPAKRYAKMLAGWGLKDADGVAWYHPQRLTDDAGAIADGAPNPAQRVMGLRAIHGGDLPRGLRIYAFGAHGGKSVLHDARALAKRSRIAPRNLTLVNRHATYAHNDPAGAFPRNAFLSHLEPFLRRIARAGRG